tara:strand:+ start:3524 stop:3871 length:348 start_codon:yes stop_codon:yes gene_type:complete
MDNGITIFSIFVYTFYDTYVFGMDIQNKEIMKNKFKPGDKITWDIKKVRSRVTNENGFMIGEKVEYISYEGATPEPGVVSSIREDGKIFVRLKSPTGELIVDIYNCLSPGDKLRK